MEPKALFPPRRRVSAWLWQKLFTQISIAWLVIFRLAFGAIMLVEVWRYFRLERIRRHYVEPDFFFPYLGFEWVKPWNGGGMYWHFYALGLLSACITAGLFYRVAAALFFLGFTYVFLLDESLYLNHFYLVSLISFLMIFVPAHKAFSMDAWKRPKLRSATVPAWSLGLLRVQIGLVYFFGGIAKLGPDWLAGEPMRQWLAARMDFPVIGSYFREERMVGAFVYGGLFLDLLVVPGLLFKPTRFLAFLAAVTFHLLNARLFTIGIFPWFMLCATMLFFPADLPGRFWQGLRSQRASPFRPARIPSSHSTAMPGDGWTLGQKAVGGLLACYLAVQVLLPLRHFAYPGNVDWTEEGHRFSWHMKLRSKKAAATFLVTNQDNGYVTEVDPLEYLNVRQATKMASRPDMILQFAHFLADKMHRQGVPNVEVRVHVMASLNGRKPQLLVDPSVDLSRQPHNLAHARWIIPLTEPLVRSNEAAGLKESAGLSEE